MPLPPKEEAKKHVILSASEISHNQSEKVYARQFFGGILHCVQNDVLGLGDCHGRYAPSQRQWVNLSVGYYFTEPLGDYRGGGNFNEVRHYIRHYAFKQNNA